MAVPADQAMRVRLPSNARLTVEFERVRIPRLAGRPGSLVDAAWAAYSSTPAAVASASQKLKLHPEEEAKLEHLQQRQRHQREDALHAAESKLLQVPRKPEGDGQTRTGAQVSSSPFKSAWRAGVGEAAK